MDVMHERVAGLDVHKDTVVAGIRVQHSGKPTRQCRTFGTTTAELQSLLDWLKEAGCSHVAMEATGVYWKPVWAILSDGPFELVLANPAHIKNVPGRKTDMNDAVWIADLMACGLIRASFVPDEATQNLRDLLRTRTQLTREQTRYAQRIHKTLESANIKLASVISDIMGKSGRAMIEAMIAGLRNPTRLAELADRRIKASPKQLYDALHGRLTDHHRFMLRLHLQQYDALSAAIEGIDVEAAAAVARLDAEVAEPSATFCAMMRRLTTIPGIGQNAAMVILAEAGLDMSRFPTAGHLLAWAGLCPGQNESAGKRRSAGLRHGAPWLKTMLVQCAWAAVRKKDSYYRAQFHRLCARAGRKQAICAVAASLLTAIYHMIKNRSVHNDLGAKHFDKRPKHTQARKLVAQLARLGYEIQLPPITQAA